MVKMDENGIKFEINRFEKSKDPNCRFSFKLSADEIGEFRPVSKKSHLVVKDEEMIIKDRIGKEIAKYKLSEIEEAMTKP